MTNKTDITAITELCADVSNGVYKLGFTGVPALRMERKIYGAMLDALLEMENPALAPLMEVVQKFNARVCYQVDEVLHPGRQPDILEQPTRLDDLLGYDAGGQLDTGTLKAMHHGEEIALVNNDGSPWQAEQVRESVCEDAPCAICNELPATHQNGFSPYPTLHLFAKRG